MLLCLCLLPNCQYRKRVLAVDVKMWPQSSSCSYIRLHTINLFWTRGATDQKTDGSDCFADQNHGSDNFSDQWKKKKEKKKDETNAVVISGCSAVFILTPVSETAGRRFKCVAMLDVFPLSYGFLVPQCRHTLTVLSTNLSFIIIFDREAKMLPFKWCEAF